MSFSIGEVNLERYRCAKCGRTPVESSELFKGCSCGYRLFRLQLKSHTQGNNIFQKQKNIQKEEMGFLTIRERQVGIYDINVEKLLQPETPETASPVIAGNDGVYSIRLNTKKNSKSTNQ